MAATSAYAVGGTASDDKLHPQRPSHQHTLSSASFVSAQSDSNEDFFSSINGLDDFGGDDDLFDMDDESRDEVKDLASDASGKNKKSKRLGANTAEKKATHNAVERARRESLNTRFLVLADMLPGMVNIKRASKAAIVNKSIDLIRELRKTESQLSKENETLKAELEAMRSQSASNAARMGALPGLPSGTNAVNAGLSFAPMGLMGYHPHAQAQAQMYQTQMQQMGLAGFPPMMPMMAPAMPQQQNSPTNASDPRPSSARSGSPQSPAFVQQAHPQFPAYPATGINGMFDFLNGQTAGPTDTAARSGSPATPASEVPALPNPAMAAAAYSGFGYPPFDLAGYVANTTASASPQAASALPGAFGGRKDSLAISAIGSGAGSQAASSPSSSTSSPPSSHSVPTPANTYSPIPLPPVLSSDRISVSPPVLAQPPAANGVSAGNPAYAAFDTGSDPAFLAASFAPRDLAKAQSDLQSFIQFQQSQARMSQAMLNFQNLMPQQMQQGQMPAIKEEHASFQPNAGRAQPCDGADMGAYFQANWGMMMGASAAAN